MSSYMVKRLLSQMARGGGGVTRRLTNAAVQKHRCALYDAEERRQAALVGRVEKMEVTYIGVPDNSTLIMNRHISTPYDCLRHVSNALNRLTVLAEVDGEPWDLHRPLVDSCSLRCLFFHEDNPFMVNKAFWRSCSLMLGSVLERAFSDDHYIELHSFPSPNVQSGSFVYDVRMSEESAAAVGADLRSLSALMRQMSLQELPFQRLDVSADLARQIFADNQYKRQQVASIAQHNVDGKVTLYRIGDFVDMSRGPAISHTGILGRCTIKSVHKLNTDFGPLYRFQGVALPASIRLNHFAYGIIEDAASTMNSGWIPSATEDKHETSSLTARVAT